MKATVVFRLFGAVLAAVVLLAIPSRAAQILAQWNFNSHPPDPTNNFPTGSTIPSLGSGTAALVGGATATFASGGGSSDPATVDDSGWNTATYPTQGTGNKTRGVRFNVSTLGFQQIVVQWDHRNSSTSSRYIRFQYSTNGTDFIDGPSLSTTTQDQFLPSKVVDLTSIPMVNNQSNFAFRIVSEFESTAVGNDTNLYIATTTGQTYSPSGTWRFDMVTISGEPYSGNEFPTISTITNRTIRMDELSPEIPFVVGDFETPANDLVVAGTSSNQDLIPNSNIYFAGSESNRTVQLFPASGASGMAVITITVTDGFGNTVSTSFTVTVLPGNTPPTISSFTNYHTVVNVPLAPIEFVIGDRETAPIDLGVLGASSNQALIPDANLVFAGSGTNRTLTITPAVEQTGNAVITVTVDDGVLTASRQFAVMVVPSPSVLLCDSFAYPDGALNANSAFRWSNHSGIAGQTQLTSGEVRLTGAQTEDVSAGLIGGPYAVNSGKVLYAGFTVNYKSLPALAGDYFAHFRGPGSGGTFHCRVFATTSNAAFGSYRLGVANNAGAATNAIYFPHDLTTDTEYLVVVRHNVATGVGTLWVNPRSEGDTNVVAADSPTAGPIFAWAFRQSNTQNGGIGTLHVDDLKVGCSFSDVLPGYRLRLTRTGQAVEISWPAAATDEQFVLESVGDLSSGLWGPVTNMVNRLNSRDSITIDPPAGNAFFRLIK